MIYTGPLIVSTVEQTKQAKAGGGQLPLPAIDIEPFDPAHAGPNSYDVRLADTLLVYTAPVLDTRQANPTVKLIIPSAGLVLSPGRLYLGSTVERIEAHGLVPWIDGRSSVGRLGMSVHVTAGRADDGWNGPLTLEITVVHPLRVYAGDRVAQVTFFELVGPRKPYSGRYTDSAGPVASRMHEGNGR